jgi:hypothetical protein
MISKDKKRSTGQSPSSSLHLDDVPRRVLVVHVHILTIRSCEERRISLTIEGSSIVYLLSVCSLICTCSSMNCGEQSESPMTQHHSLPSAPSRNVTCFFFFLRLPAASTRRTVARTTRRQGRLVFALVIPTNLLFAHFTEEQLLLIFGQTIEQFSWNVEIVQDLSEHFIL